MSAPELHRILEERIDARSGTLRRAQRRVGRRLFLTDLGRGAVGITAIALLGACGDDDDDDGATPTATTTPAPTEAPADTPTPAATSVSTPSTAVSGGDADPEYVDPGDVVSASPLEWERVSLGFVSAYVVARNGEAAVIDAGVGGSEGEIEAALGVLELGWSDVGCVILTHSHGDHVGSLPAILEAAPDARGYAGMGDIPSISSPRELIALGDGDRIFDLRIIETPGHTPGHISVLDPAGGGILFAGDALNEAGGEVLGPNPSFTPDMTTALQSARALADFQYDVLLTGHGEPILEGASDLVRTYVETL